jgi:titin
VTPAAAPGAPTDVSGVRGNGQVTVSWTAPASNGSAITDYTVQYSTDGTNWTTFSDSASISTSSTVTGLVNGTAYTFRVKATNGVGDSAASTPSASVTPAAAPGAPTDVSGVRGNGQVTVSWTAPASNGSAITGYTVSASPQVGAVTKTCTSATTSCIVTGLTNGVAYTFTVKATNAVSDSVASNPSASVTPATVPGVPTNLEVLRGNAKITVSWVAPASNGGSAITGYTVQAYTAAGAAVAGKTCTTATTSCIVSGLTNATSYKFAVKATNAVNSSAFTALSAAIAPSAVTPTVPGAPTAVTGVRGNGQVTVSWTAPTSDGGATITSYTVSASPQVSGVTKTCTSATTSCIVTGLTNGVAYTFTVIATSDIGNSTPGSSAAVTPATIPGAPTAVSGVGGNTQVTVSWTAPADNGGSAVTGYTVQAYFAGVVVPLKTCTTATTSCIVTGLTNGADYTFKVKATNVIGSSVDSSPSASVTPATVPGAPTISSVMANVGKSATIRWTAPASNGGSAITGYTVQAYKVVGLTATIVVGKTCTAEAGTLNCSITGLTAGTSYKFYVVATNVKGNSANAISVAVTAKN